MVFRKVRIKRKIYICKNNETYESLRHQTFSKNPFQPA